MVFRLVLESSRQPLTIPQALHGRGGGEWCLGRFLERLLSEVFIWRQHLPSWSDEVDELVYPPAPGYGA
jgi:hypothetical protein